MNKQYILKTSNANVEEVKSNIIQDLNQRIGARQDCKVVIQALDFSFETYWVMIGNIVKWDADNHGYKADVWDGWFKREAGLVNEVDMMELWKMRYKEELNIGFVLKTFDEKTYGLKRYHGETSCYHHTFLGERFITKTRSISSKGDVTKEEMSRLLMAVIKFGGDNIPGWIGIKDTELENMLKSYDR